MTGRILFLVAILIFVTLSEIAMSQPPPPPSGGHGNNNNQSPGNGAPIGDGRFILSILAVIYAGKKVNDLRKDEAEK